MAELDIKWLQDKNNTKYFPVAHMNGVVADSNGTTVGSIINTISGSVTAVDNRVTQLSGKTISAGTGISITKNGAISATPAISLATVTITSGYTGSGVTTSTGTFDTRGRVSTIAPIIYSATPITANVSNAVTVPSSMTGTGKSGSQYCLIFKNNTSADYTIAVSTSYKTPDGAELKPTCKAGGYTELNFLNIGGVIYARGV